jgi:hypothetical protein
VEERKASLEMEDHTASLMEMDKCKAVLMRKALLEMGDYQKKPYIHTKAPTWRRKLNSQLNLPTTPNDISAKMSRVTKDDVGRWH